LTKDCTLSNDNKTAPSTTIGKFQVIGQLGRGGMADVFVCRLHGIGGFDKEVVLKRILPERADDPHFVKMFLDEARVVANLNHPNIVQVFEIGEQDGIPFMAMEYIKGVTLGMIIRETRKRQKINYVHSATLIAGICDALEYAHHANGPDGHPLGLVHRDVTPGNIVVSRTGTPKLLDFGVARARGRLAHTEAGTIKGKLRYMAPEQITQGPLDHRADIFSLGVCLFELTTGHHPFGPPNASEVATLKNIMNGTISRPTDLVPGFPPTLEAIILSAIDMDVQKRCPSAAELRQRLEAFVAASGRSTNQRELVTWLKELFPDFGNLTKTGAVTAFNGGNLSGATPSGRQPTASVLQAVVDGSHPSAAGLPDKVTIAAPLARRWKWALGAGLALLAGVTMIGLLVNRSRPLPVVPPPVAVAPSRSAPPTLGPDDSAAAYLDAAEKLAAEKRFEPALDLVAKTRELNITRPDLNIRLARINDSLLTASLLRKANLSVKDRNWRGAVDAAKDLLDREPENQQAIQILATARAALAPRTTEAVKGRESGFISITTTPPAMVYVDDEPIGRSPIRQRSISSGRHTIQVRAPGYRASETDVKVAPRQTVALVLPLTAESAAPSHGRSAAEPESAALGAIGRTSSSPVGNGEPAGRIEDEGESPASRPRPVAPASLPENGVDVVAKAGPARPGESSSATSASRPPVESRVAPRPAAGPPMGRVLPGGAIVSAKPKSPIPKPTLPRTFFASDAEQVARACVLVEMTIVSQAGVSPDWARGVTGPFRRLVGTNAEVYPVAMYYFLIREAGMGHDNKKAAANLAGVHSSGLILKFKNLPAIDRKL
jgi:eukaryotic-like serine/threonine-protein kinase